MSSTGRALIDPDRRLLLSLVGIAGIGVVALLTSIRPAYGLTAAAAVATAVLAVGMHSKVGLTPMWPLTVVALLQPLNGIRILPFVAIGDVALIVLFLVVLTTIQQARIHEPQVVMLAGMLIVTSGGTIGLMVAEDWSGIGGMAKFVLGAPVVVALLIMLNPNRRETVLLLTAYSCGAALSAVKAAIEPVDPSFGRSDGLGAHAGHLALAGILGFFVFVGWCLTARSVPARLAASLAGLLCLFGVLLSGTRSAVIAVAVGVLFLALAARWRGIMLLGGLVTGMVVFLTLIVPTLPNRNNIQRAFGMGELGGNTQLTNDLHEDALRAAVRLIGEHPWFGVGFSEGQTAHNLVLQVANMGGLLAVLGLIVIWIPVAYLALGRLNEGLSRANTMATCAITSVLAYFVFAQFQPVIWDRHLWFFITLAVILQLQPPVSGGRDATTSPAARAADS